MSNEDESLSPLIPDGCDRCPNRGQVDGEATVKFGSYVFAGILTIFVSYTCYTSDRRDEPIPVGIVLPCLLLIAGSLGVNVSPAELATVFGLRSSQ